MKLLTKYSLVTLLVMIVIFLISSLSINKLIQVVLIKEMDADLEGVEAKIHTYVDQYKSLPPASPLNEARISFTPAGSRQPAHSSELVQLYSDREKKMHNFRRRDFPLWYNDEWYLASVAKPVEGIHHLSSGLLQVSIATILFTIVTAMILNSVVLRRMWRPFYSSMEIMRNYKLGEKGPLNLPATTIEEFSFMNESLLLAMGKADRDYLLLKEFTENASHEMQTPLSIIRSKLDMLIQEEGLTDKQSQLAAGAYASIKRLSRLNQSLLLLAKIENRQFNNVMWMDLRREVSEKIGQFEELWVSRHISVTLRLQDSSIEISPDLLDILLNNLFSNATNHNTYDGCIDIETQPGRLVISNTGPDGPLDEERLFSRFYKGSAASGSNGLGLSIIKQISSASSIKTSYQFIDGMHSFVLSW